MKSPKEQLIEDLEAELATLEGERADLVKQIEKLKEEAKS